MVQHTLRSLLYWNHKKVKTYLPLETTILHTVHGINLFLLGFDGLHYGFKNFTNKTVLAQ